MFDYGAWVRRAVAFAQELSHVPAVTSLECNAAPPLGAEEISELAASLPQGLPDPLKHFLAFGSGNCDCHYVRTLSQKDQPELQRVFPRMAYIYGGARLCNAGSLVDDQLAFDRWIQSLERNQIADPWYAGSTPFVALQNGDYLVLRLAAHGAGHQVVYADHEQPEHSRVVSRTFEEFLSAWEKVCYIGPEIWLLRAWCDENGYLAPSESESRFLRDLMRH